VARSLIDAGVVAVELDALTFDDRCLIEVGRLYRGAMVEQIATGLAAEGVTVGIVLAPGLPGSTHDLGVADAVRAAPLVTTARIHPVLVLHDSGLREHHLDGRYEALTLGQALTTCREMMDVLEAADVAVIRVGQQPGPDELGRAVAGPAHPAFRQLVESRRTLARLLAHCREIPVGVSIEVRCAPADETRTRGPLNQHVRQIRAERRGGSVTIVADPSLERGQLVVTPLPAKDRGD
jgi:histone acetyltransferase (RNA polymerase elongator complex component)